MPQFRTSFLTWLLAGSVALTAGTEFARAQEDTKPKDTPKVEEEKPTPWPPPNTEKHEVKRDEADPKGLILHTPKTWKKGAGNRLRLAEFSIPPAEGDKEPVELTVFSFSGGGGGIPANVERWINQFQAEGRKVKVTGGEGHQGLYVLVDLQGTYNMPIGPPIQQKTTPLPNARMLALIIGIPLEAENGDPKQGRKAAAFFLKLAGPEKTVTANEEAFRLAFGAANRSKEKNVDVKQESN